VEHLKKASPAPSTRCANGWHLFPVLRLRDRPFTIVTAVDLSILHSTLILVESSLRSSIILLPVSDAYDLTFCFVPLLGTSRAVNLVPDHAFFKPHSPFMWSTVFMCWALSHEPQRLSASFDVQREYFDPTSRFDSVFAF